MSLSVVTKPLEKGVRDKLLSSDVRRLRTCQVMTLGGGSLTSITLQVLDAQLVPSSHGKARSMRVVCLEPSPRSSRTSTRESAGPSGQAKSIGSSARDEKTARDGKQQLPGEILELRCLATLLSFHRAVRSS